MTDSLSERGGRAAPFGVTVAGMGRIQEHVSVVTVSEPVSGRPQRRERAPEARARSSRVERSRVDPGLLAAAQRVMRPGQRLVIVDATTVRLVNA